MRRVFWILITPLVGFLILAGLASWIFIPKLEAWSLQQLHSYSERSLPIGIKAEKLEISFLRPSVSLQQVEIRGKGSLQESLPLISVKSARAYLDFFQLFVGRLQLSGVVIENVASDINIDPFVKDDSPAKELPINDLFALLESLPLQRVFLKNADLKIHSEVLNFSGAVKSGDLLLTNQRKNLAAKLSIPELNLNLKKVGEFNGALDAHLFLTPQSLRIIQLSTRLGQSEIIAKGELTRISQIAIKPTGFVDLTGKISLGDIHTELTKLRPDLKLPLFSGDLHTELEARFDGLKQIRAKANLDTRSLVFDKLELGDARIQGEYEDGIISLSEIRAHHPAGEAVLRKTQIELDGNYNFKSQVSVTGLDLQKLFQSLNLGSIPVGLDLDAELPCEGSLSPSPQLNCSNVILTGRHLWVKNGSHPKDKEIVALDSINAKGQVKVTKQAVSYAAAVDIGDSSGSSDGNIDFAKGFKINFKTNKLDFKNIRNLVNLKMVGNAGLEGFTEGDSNAATFEMNLNARNFVFEDFNLGNLLTVLSYNKGHLFIKDIAGAINKTQYLGELQLDLNKDHISGEFSIPTAELNDLAFVFAQIQELPFGVQGTGGAKARVDGPLEFWKMNYKLESAFKNVFIGPENFDQLTFNVSASDGNIKTDKVLLQRGNASLNLNGGISSEKVLNLNADGKNWRLEESDSVTKVNSNIMGLLNFSAELKAPINDPQILLKGSVTDTFFEEQEIPNSHFVIKTNRHNVGGQLSLFGDRVQGEFQYPFEKGKSPLSIKMTTKKWEYSSLLGLIGGANLANEYESSLTSTIDITSESGDIFKATGKILAPELSLRRGSLSFANQGPVEITADQGVISIKRFHLEGPQNVIQLKGNSFTANNLDLSVNARCDLHLLQIFAPFLEDMGGPVSVAATVSGSVQKPEVLGNANAANTYIKIKGFPHPLEKLSADVVFSQSRILLNSIKGQLAGGSLTGDGGILINGIKNIPTSIRLHLEGVSFNVPDKVRSSGNADLLLSGSWFPFTLSGTYHVFNGLVEKEFTEDTGVAGVKQSFYLPKVIRESQFEPILLDLQLLISRHINVKNSLIDGSVSGQLQIKGPPANPILIGRINTEKGSKLIFKDKIFDIQNGAIDFNDPNEINPNLYISANSRIDEYDITLIAQGPSKNLTVRMNSVPPLPEQDIISLIALGVTSSNMDQNLQSRQQAEQLGVEIGGAVLAKPISRQLESTLGLNLQVTSQYDSTRNISVPKITLSRRLSEKIKASGSRPMRDAESYDLKLEYLLNSNWTAVGSFESRGASESTTLQSTQQESQSIFGLDLEFKREFK